jgi:hypothetical protein
MRNMNNTNSQMVQPPPHELPAAEAAYAGWTFAGIAVYGVFFVACAAVFVLWSELRKLRASTELLVARISEARDAVRESRRP